MMDGVLSDQTTSAILTFQLDRGLPMDGQVTNDFLIILRALQQQPQAGQASSGSQLSPIHLSSELDMGAYEAQARLNSLGYEAGQADGVPSAPTTNAILKFQLDRGLPMDGKVTDQLLVVLRSSSQQQLTGQDSPGPNSEAVADSQPPPVPVVYQPARTGNAQPTRTSQPSAVPVYSPPSAVSQAVGMLTPTPIYSYTAASGDADWAGLNVPDQLWTVENGIRIPHPVTLNGRVLNVRALAHYVQWNGLALYGGDIYKALTDYLLLAALGENPDMLDEFLFTFAVRFLPERDRGAYPCNPAEPASENPCGARYADSLLRGDKWLNNVFTTDEYKEAIKQRVLAKRGELLAAAPALPVKLVDVGQFELGPYDNEKGGIRLNFGLTSEHRFHAQGSKKAWYYYRNDTAGDEEWQGPLVAQVQTAPDRTIFSTIPGGGVSVAKVGPSYASSNVGTFLSGFWKVDQQQGQALINRFNGAAWIQYHVNLSELSIEEITYWKWKMHLGPVTAYKDQHLKQELHRFSCDIVPGCSSGFQP
jgi:peptidoglycan hydrolase-like protein with peptidoglycan-binding domain